MSLSNLESFLRSVQADTQLQEFQEPVRSELEALDHAMARFFDSPLGILRGVSEHLLGVSGKRFRPTVLMLIAKMGDDDPEDTVFAASVIELIHTATLIHDDTIDRSAVRRGLPTLNALFNDQVSTILGDYIYTKAFVELIDRELPKLVPVVARTTYRMTVGEVLAIEQKDDIDITEEDYFHLLNEKTASLMGASAQIGGLLGGMDDAQVAELHEFGEDLGRAYQVTDDLFDFVGDADQLGKGVASDLHAGKITLPLIYAMRQEGSTNRRFLRDLARRKSCTDEEWVRLGRILKSAAPSTIAETGPVDCRLRWRVWPSSSRAFTAPP
ncbi:MAG: polyprenyl synthetase family protein [Candidatus Eisenbacteria bacterium]